MPHSKPSDKKSQEENDEYVATFFKEYITRYHPKMKKKASAASSAPLSSIHDIRYIGLKINSSFHTDINRIVDTWKSAIKEGMYARTQKFVDYIDKVDPLVDNLLWPLMLASTRQQRAEYKGQMLSYHELDELLHKKLAELKKTGRANFNNITVPVRTLHQRKSILESYQQSLGLSSTPLSQFRETRRGDRITLPQPISGLPVSMSLSEYTNQAIFQFRVLEALKDHEIAIAFTAVAQANTNPEFMRELQRIVESDNEPSKKAEQLITTVKDQCIEMEKKHRSRSRSPRRSQERRSHERRSHERRSQERRSQERKNTRRLSRSRSRSLSHNRNQHPNRRGGYTRRVKNTK
jgi:hypothetical protein